MTSVEDIRETIARLRRRVLEIDTLIALMEPMGISTQAVGPAVYGSALALITSTRRLRASTLLHLPAA
jgi:hypothetical protein